VLKIILKSPYRTGGRTDGRRRRARNAAYCSLAAAMQKHYGRSAGRAL